MGVLYAVFLVCLLETCGGSSNSSFKRLLVRNTVGNHFSEVIVDALNRYYVQDHSSTMVMRLATVGRQTYNLQSDIMDEVMQRTSHSIAYVFRSDNSHARRPRFFNLAFIDGYDAFRKLFNTFDPASNDFSGYYLIVLTTFERLQPIMFERIFGYLWTLNVINVNIITANLQDFSHWQNVLMYTYYPYRPDVECERIVPTLLHRFRKGQKLDEEVDIFPNKLINFHRCRITVGTFHLPPWMMLTGGGSNTSYGGVEGDLLHALSRKLNFTVRLIVPHDGELWGDTPFSTEEQDFGNSSGCVRLVLTERVNITLGRFAIRGDRNLWMKHSRGYYTVHMVFAVPAGREYTAFEKLFLPFSRTTWILIGLYLLVALVVILTIWFAQVPVVRTFVFGRDVTTPVQNLFLVFFGGALLKLPTRNFARTLLFLWMYYSLVVRTLYQGSLFEYLQEHKNFSPPETVEALVRDKYRVYSLSGSSIYLKELPELEKRTTWLPNDDASFERLLNELAELHAPNTVLFTDVERIAHHNRFRSKTGPVHVASTVVVRLPIGMYYPKKSCLVNQFDREIDNLLMSGYFTYRLRHHVDYDLFRHRSTYQEEPTPLTNVQLEGCYDTLLVLLFTSTVLLLVELASRWIGPLRVFLTMLQTE